MLDSLLHLLYCLKGSITVSRFVEAILQIEVNKQTEILDPNILFYQSKITQLGPMS